MLDKHDLLLSCARFCNERADEVTAITRSATLALERVKSAWMMGGTSCFSVVDMLYINARPAEFGQTSAIN